MQGRQISGRPEPLTAAMVPPSPLTLDPKPSTGPGRQSIPSVLVLADSLSRASCMSTAGTVLTGGAAGRVQAGTLVLLLAGSHSRLGRLGQLAARLAAQHPRPAPPVNGHCPGCSLCLRLGGRRLLIGPCLPPVNGLACVAVGHALVLDSRLVILHRTRVVISSVCGVRVLGRHSSSAAAAAAAAKKGRRSTKAVIKWLLKRLTVQAGSNTPTGVMLSSRNMRRCASWPLWALQAAGVQRDQASC